MIKVIEDAKQIQKLHNLFHEKLDSYCSDKVDCWVGFPGGNFENTVRYSYDLNIWVSILQLENRFWNGFGIGKPVEGANNSLVGEINFPLEGINRRIAGAFAKDSNGNILVLHRGKIGGGKKGVGKTLFMNEFGGDFIKAIDGEIETEFCLIGDLNSQFFLNQVSFFIQEVYRIKNQLDDSTQPSFSYLTKFNYTDEHSGVTITERNEPTLIERTHGLVVNALDKKLKSKGFKTANDKNRDLFIHKGKQIKILFEIKTSSATQCLYSAIGQLLIYSIPIKNSVKLVAVLPTKLNKLVAKRFSDIGIEILYYKWNNEKVEFIDLDRILSI
ncbi:hypothetical protein [Pedobacter sp. SL55]|uniref:hypothetical protein n=1 Tax=Pedobacter sp. SL55 TaxID=2995161 RepID=UPI002270228D|nr:hypothetical protein [Pedobacter sp. SL55]WAC39350.1 hypothetical protein OVA16_12115 [Pedobacter sp. SL55]